MKLKKRGLGPVNRRKRSPDLVRGHGVRAPTADVKRVQRVHDGLVGDRRLAGTDYLADARLRRQYETEIAPRTEAQLARVLARVFPGGDGGVRRVLDLGAGTGAAGRALRDHFGPALSVVSVDRVAGPGVVVGDVSRERRPGRVEGRFDLIVTAHLLCELVTLDAAARARMVLGWFEDLLEPGGLCIIVEPALRETARALLKVRDELRGHGLHIVAPCLWQGPCPALDRPRDWCHDSAPWNPPVDPGPRRPTPDRRADFSYLVLQAPHGGPRVQDTAPDEFRVVSDLKHEKGRLRIWGCGPVGRHALVLQIRDRGIHNEAFETITRGDRIRVVPTRQAGDGLRLMGDTRVEILNDEAPTRTK